VARLKKVLHSQEALVQRFHHRAKVTTKRQVANNSLTWVVKTYRTTSRTRFHNFRVAPTRTYPERSELLSSSNRTLWLDQTRPVLKQSRVRLKIGIWVEVRPKLTQLIAYLPWVTMLALDRHKVSKGRHHLVLRPLPTRIILRKELRNHKTKQQRDQVAELNPIMIELRDQLQQTKNQSLSKKKTSSS